MVTVDGWPIFHPCIGRAPSPLSMHRQAPRCCLIILLADISRPTRISANRHRMPSLSADNPLFGPSLRWPDCQPPQVMHLGRLRRMRSDAGPGTKSQPEQHRDGPHAEQKNKGERRPGHLTTPTHNSVLHTKSLHWLSACRLVVTMLQNAMAGCCGQLGYLQFSSRCLASWTSCM